jgi:hypothetical protein
VVIRRALGRPPGGVVDEDGFLDRGELEGQNAGEDVDLDVVLVLVAELADRGWDAIVAGEYERAFCGSEYAA